MEEQIKVHKYQSPMSLSISLLTTYTCNAEIQDDTTGGIAFWSDVIGEL